MKTRLWKMISLLAAAVVVMAGLSKSSTEEIEKRNSVLVPESSVTKTGDERTSDVGENVFSGVFNEGESFFINVSGGTIETRFFSPVGYERIPEDDGSFQEYVRTYPLKESGEPILLYNGTVSEHQWFAAAVFKLPIENINLQQCADSIMRFYAEYFYATEQYDRIGFHFVNGFYADFASWSKGARIDGRAPDKWVYDAGPDMSYESFQKYMNVIFNYGSTISMKKESYPITVEEADIGDIFIRAGSPGHAVMIVDVCQNEAGQKAFLLAQGLMPAQEFHVIINERHAADPWYYEDELKFPFQTPGYEFGERSLRRLAY